MWKNNLVIQGLTKEMEFAVLYSITEDSFSQELWISQVPGAVGLLRAQTLPGGYLRLNPRFNSPGTIDQGYIGEIKIILFNTNNHQVIVERGMKVAQAVLANVVSGKFVTLNKIENVEQKERGSNGFGSTGI